MIRVDERLLSILFGRIPAHILMGFFLLFPLLGQSAEYEAPAQPIERIFWNKTPIQLSLQVGKERLIHFSEASQVQVGLPGKLGKNMIRTQILQNTVYWLAKEPFRSERIQVVDPTTGQTFLFDLRAELGKGGTAPVEVVTAIPDREKAKQNLTDAAKQKNIEYDYVTLTRFASQQMYAPTRLLEDLPGVVRLQIDTETEVPLVRGGKVEALPLISWKAGNLYVTSIRLKNRTEEYITLDPRDLRGDWLTATFQHARLFPQGRDDDTTCVYLISDRPFQGY